MLELLALSCLSVFSKNKSWYHSLWLLSLSFMLSLILLYSDVNSFLMPNMFVANESMSNILISLTLWISIMMIMGSQQNVKISFNSPKSFIYFLLLLNFVLLTAFSMVSILWFYFFFEASLIPTLLIILGWGYQPERLQASMYMMLYTVLASLPLLLAILFTTQNFCSSSMYMFSSLRYINQNIWMESIFFIVIILAFLVKLPMFSVHLWLPKAHVEAPVAGSMVLAAILLKLGGYGIMRVFQFYSPSISVSTSFTISLGLWGGMLTSVMCFRQIDFKALIAYSSVGHMSLMLAGAISNTTWGFNGALILMISHGFCSSALFALANFTYEKSHSRSLLLVKGFLLVSPAIALWWFLFSVLNMASPPSINLLGEIMIFPALLYNSLFLVFPLALMSFLSAMYSMYLYTSTQHGGSPWYKKPFSPLNDQMFTLMVLHWIPANILILKSELIMF